MLQLADAGVWFLTPLSARLKLASAKLMPSSAESCGSKLRSQAGVTSSPWTSSSLSVSQRQPRANHIAEAGSCNLLHPQPKLAKHAACEARRLRSMYSCPACTLDHLFNHIQLLNYASEEYLEDPEALWLLHRLKKDKHLSNLADFGFYWADRWND